MELVTTTADVREGVMVRQRASVMNYSVPFGQCTVHSRHGSHVLCLQSLGYTLEWCATIALSCWDISADYEAICAQLYVCIAAQSLSVHQNTSKKLFDCMAQHSVR